MGAVGLHDDALKDHHRSSFLTTTSTCCSVVSESRRLSSYDSYTTQDWRATERILEEEDPDTVKSQKQLQTQLFASYSIRVLKQVPLPDWVKIFVPRIVRLQTGTVPYMEYKRSEMGEIRQRKLLSVWTRVDRLPKNALSIDFQQPDVSSNDRSSSDKWVLKFETKHDRDVWAKNIQDAIDLLAWINKFTLGAVLFSSANSQIAECYTWNDRDGRPSFVLKAMNADSKKKTHNARNEINIQRKLTNYSTHPNLVHLQDAFRQRDRAYLIQENCAGGDLYEHLSQNGYMAEAQAKILFRHIAEAIAYIHEQGVVHLDIKPENLFFKTSPMQLETIKLGDFGSAHSLNEELAQGPVSCTIGYAAPEVLELGEVNFAADVFSAGAVLYTVLCGYSPFNAPSDEEMLERTLVGEIVFDDLEWARVSNEAKELISGMLHPDPKLRLSMEEVLDHPWLQL